MLLHHINWILLGLSHCILSYPAPRTDCSELFPKLIASPHGPACPCQSVHQRCQKVNMMTNEGSSTQLWEWGAECTLHLLSTCFCAISNPLGLLKRDPTHKKLNRVIVLLVRVSTYDQSFEKGELEPHSQAVWYGNEVTNPQETELWGYPR